jgi:hypothetical protein
MALQSEFGGYASVILDVTMSETNDQKKLDFLNNVKKQQIAFPKDENSVGRKNNIKERTERHIEETDIYLTDRRKCAITPAEEFTKGQQIAKQQTTNNLPKKDKPSRGNSDKTVTFLTETAREIPKINEYSLKRLFKLKKSFYTIMELSVVYYIHYDMALVAASMEQYRKIFINAFYDACKNMGKSMGKELTVAQLDSLIDDITLILKDDKLLDIYWFPARLFATSKNDAPYKESNWADWTANFLEASLVPVALKEHLNIMFKEMDVFKRKLINT